MDVPFDRRGEERFLSRVMLLFDFIDLSSNVKLLDDNDPDIFFNVALVLSILSSIVDSSSKILDSLPTEERS
eukprot:11186487-Ditylum_brightwellii.AAC.1